MRLDLPGKLNHFEDALYNPVYLSIRGKTCHSRMDALTEILKSVRLEGAVFFNAEFTAPWGFRSPPSSEVAAFLRKGSRHVIIYQLVLAGRQSNDRKKEKPIDRVQEDFPTMFGQRPDSPPFANQPTRPICGGSWLVTSSSVQPNLGCERP